MINYIELFIIVKNKYVRIILNNHIILGIYYCFYFPQNLNKLMTVIFTYH